MPILYESYSKSPEVRITAQRIPTQTTIYLWNEAQKERMEGKTVFVGTKIIVRVVLAQKVDGLMDVRGKTLRVFHRVNAGAWKKIKETTQDPYGAVDVLYTLDTAGTHDFYGEFPGDATHAGCSKAVRLFAR